MAIRQKPLSNLKSRFDRFTALPARHRVIAVLAGVFLLTQTLAIIVSVLELTTLQATNSKSVADAYATRAQNPVKKQVKPPVDPLAILPGDLPGTLTKMRQEMPGSGRYAAEAIYVPSNEEQAVRDPFSVYASVSYTRSPNAGKVIRRRLAENGIKPEKITIGRQTGLGGLTPEGERYLVGWVTGRYVIEVDGAFARRVAGQAPPMIEFTRGIAEQLDKSASERLGSVGGRSS